MSKKVLVTGGAGFIGSNITSSLLDDGFEVYVADNMSSDNQQRNPEGIEDFYNMDLTDEDKVGELFREIKPHEVYHLAASSNVRADGVGTAQFGHNTSITQNIVTHAQQTTQPDIIFTSSSTVYGSGSIAPNKETDVLEPISYYASGKIGSEALLRTYSSQSDGYSKIFRLANIVGPNLRNAVIPDFIEKLLEDGESLRILGNGQQEKSYMHVDDCVNAIRTINQSSESDVVVNIATETTTTVTEIADIVSDVMNLNPDYNYTGGSQGWTGDVPKVKLDITKMRSFGYEPSFTSDEAVRKSAKQILNQLN